MYALLFFVALLGLSSALSCPSQYELMEGRCIRPLVLEQQYYIDTELPNSREECDKDKANLPIIKSDEDNKMFNRIANSLPGLKGQNIWLVLDLICNSTGRLQWVDGTEINYVPKGSQSINYDCGTSMQTFVSYVMGGTWIVKVEHDSNYKTVICVIDSHDQCGDYSLIDNPTDGAKPCFKVFTSSMSWENAQAQCAADFGSLITINSAEENKYFWRTAISNNILEGMHIGAHQSNGSTSQWAWIDGEVPFDGKTYSNFVSFFPVPGSGECSSMATENSAAQWINEDCKRNEQPFICRRSDFSNVPSTCPTEPVKVGEDFFPPGFPNSDIACEYYLIVSAKKLVQLEIMTLVAQDNKDYLEILEGTSGPHLIANLTGTVLTTTAFTTMESNVMRVNWKPSGTGSGRGFRIRYNEIDP